MGVVEIRGLTKRFGSVTPVDRLDLRIDHGELISLLGPSGCGKTTTLRLLAGFLNPDGGEILVGGKLLSAPGRVVPPQKRKMSMIFQSYAVWPHKSVFENVAYGLQLRGMDRVEIKKRVDLILRAVQLSGYETRYPSELSGGQQQRVALARALVVEPETLLLDEPLSNLDANLREEMRFEIRRLHDEFGFTAVYVTHDQSEAMVTSDRVAVMNTGKVVQIGTPEEIYARPATRFVATFLGRSNIVAGKLAGQGVVRCPEGSLVRAEQPRPMTMGEDVLVNFRPHGVKLCPPEGDGREPDPGDNVLSGRVVRHIYLGNCRDYQVAVEGMETPIRIEASPSVYFPVGAAVRVAVPPSECRILTE